VSQLKARLTVLLKADDVVVAEAEDALLWQRVLKAINSGSAELADESPAQRRQGAPPAAEEPTEPDETHADADSFVGKLARQLGVGQNVVTGACDPTVAEPYLHLDMHNWSAVKTQLPPRGASALSPVVVASTLLALWFRAANLGNPTQAQAQRVLATINVQDKNASRGLKGAPWLQTRSGGQVVVNAAQIERAILLAKCFCLKDWKPWKTALAEA
jgi:hypothetical protein